MRKGKWKRSLTAALYDRQITGKKIGNAKKSFQEVCRILKNDSKK